MKILVTGCAGMLGSSVYPKLIKKGHFVKATDINLTDSWLEFLDVRDKDKISEYTKNLGLDMIMHLAAETNLETCELNKDQAHLTNAVGTENIALTCKKLDIPMVYVSTAGVFDGTKEGLYNESDKPNPINVYGETKFQGEQIVQNILRKYFIARAGWMIGGGEKDKKFIMKIIKQLDEGKKELFVVDDKYGTPTYTEDFSECLSNLMLTDYYGLYHMVCKGAGTRYDVASELIKYLGRTDVKLTRVDSDYFKEEFFVPRPRSEMMENLMLEEKCLNTMRDWKEALHEYLDLHFSSKKIKVK